MLARDEVLGRFVHGKVGEMQPRLLEVVLGGCLVLGGAQPTQPVVEQVDLSLTPME